MMKRAVILATLPLVCSASPAFIYHAPAGLKTNSPGLGDVDQVGPRPTHLLQNRRRHRGRQLEASLGGAAPSIAGVVASSASFAISRLPTALAAVVGLLVGASVLNALQGGIRGDLGSTTEKILGVPAEEATAEHVSRLGKAEFMQLFHASTCPEAGDLDGEYRARTLEMGILHPVTAIITHRIWGPGRWLGKGIRAGSSEGYNLFSPGSRTSTPAQASDLPADTLRERPFGFSQFSESVFDKGVSSRLDYAKPGRNGPLFGGMRDEVRKVNDKLFVGLGYIQAFGGKYNSAPFVLEGPPVQQSFAPDSGKQ